MAKMLPNIDQQRVIFASSAEQRVYMSLKEQLDDRWTVYYSLTLSEFENNHGLVDNEIDFLVYHPSYGALAIEVKGGRIGFDAGSQKFYSINRQDRRFSIKNPFHQAMIWKNRFVRFLRKGQLRLPVSHAVCFPSIHSSEIRNSASSLQDLVIGRNSLDNIESKIIEIVRASQPSRFLTFKDVAHELDQALIGSNYQSRFYLRDYIDVHEDRVQDVESIQESFVKPIVSANRLGIEGEAGTGKTMLACLVAAERRQHGDTVLMLTSNAQLNEHLRKSLPKEVTVATYEEWGASFGVSLLRMPQSFKGSREDWVQVEAPVQLLKLISQSAIRFDAIICDEAQDAKPFWWDCIEAALKSQDSSRLYIFFDRSQGVFATGDGDRFAPEGILPVGSPYFPLVHNYRTTNEIASFARNFRTGSNVLAAHSSRLGYLPEICTYQDRDDLQAKLGILVSHLTNNEGVEPSEMTVLSARRPDAPESTLLGVTEIASLPVKLLNGRGKKKRVEGKSLAVSTIAGFKGLESSIGIILNLSEYKLPLDHPLMSSLLYVALTRAKHMLYIFVQKDDPKLKVLRNALNKINSTGAFVVDANDNSAELIGTVVHYNPKRLGFIKIQTESISRSNVMFFHSDIEAAGLNEVCVGTKLRFRLRNEGEQTIAVDLQEETSEVVVKIEA
jgi:hypothetical protein